MSTIESGCYTITNVKQKQLAAILEAQDGCPVSASTVENSKGELWIVTRLSNGKYIIKNAGYNFYAYTGARAEKGSTVEGKMKPKYWNTQESRVKNQFTIATTDTEVFWGLTDDQPHTPVDLAEIASDSRQWWMFHPTSNSVTAASAIPPQASLPTATVDSAHKKASMLSSRPPEVKPQTQQVQSAGDI